METNTEKEIGVLNSLVEINKDRMDGYELAAKETEDESLKNLFTEFASDSKRFHQVLSALVLSMGGKPVEGTTISGKFYRAWMDIKAALTGKDKKSIIASCEFGEDAALGVYNSALTSDTPLSVGVRVKVEDQKQKIQGAHDRIKMLRDSVIA